MSVLQKNKINESDVERHIEYVRSVVIYHL